MVCHHCGVKGHRVNECPKINDAQHKQFWEERNKARREKANTASKDGNSNADIAEVAAAVPSEDDAARVKYKRYQRLMSALKYLDIGMIQVGHSDTGVLEATNAGINVLSCGKSNPGKHVYWDKSIERVSKRFTLDAHKLYLDICATYQS